VLGQIQPYQQQERFTCSAATLSAVLKHWGVNVDEPTLTRAIGAKPKIGAAAPQIAKAARQYGFAADVHTFRSLDELDSYVGRKRRSTGRPTLPVIANIFSFTRPGQGHFVVIDDVNDAHVRIMDPNAPTNWRKLTHPEMKRRWMGRGGVGIIVRPRNDATRKRGLSDMENAAPIAKKKGGWGALALVSLAWLGIVGFGFWRKTQWERKYRYRRVART